MFDLAIDSKLRGCDILKIKIGDLVSGGRIRSRAIVVQQKPAAPFSSNSSSLPVAVYSPGSNVEEAPSTTTLSRAGLTMAIISAPGSMPGSSTSGFLDLSVGELFATIGPLSCAHGRHSTRSRALRSPDVRSKTL
jgi:hypothetical protein